jgi:hypothetical protein
MVKVISWYDNEWGYSQRVVDLAEVVAKNWKAGRGPSPPSRPSCGAAFCCLGWSVAHGCPDLHPTAGRSLDHLRATMSFLEDRLGRIWADLCAAKGRCQRFLPGTGVWVKT